MVTDLIRIAHDRLPGHLRDGVVVFGSAPLVLAGMRATARDLDLFASATTFADLVALGFELRDESRGVVCVRLAAQVSVYKTWPGAVFSKVYARAAPCPGSLGLRVASLEHVLAYKRVRNAEKDAADILLLQEHFAAASCR